MKKYISAILIPCFLLQLFGCYSFRQISLVENSELVEIENYDVRLTLTNGEKIPSKAYHHTLVTHPSEFIIGEVNRYNPGYKYQNPFAGKIFLSDIDSTSFNAEKRIYTVLLKSKDNISFFDGDYFVVTDETEPGFWYWDKNTTIKVDVSEISSIEADKFNVVNTVLLSAAALTVLIFALAGLAASQMNLHFFPGGSL